MGRYKLVKLRVEKEGQLLPFCFKLPVSCTTCTGFYTGSTAANCSSSGILTIELNGRRSFSSFPVAAFGTDRKHNIGVKPFLQLNIPIDNPVVTGFYADVFDNMCWRFIPYEVSIYLQYT